MSVKKIIFLSVGTLGLLLSCFVLHTFFPLVRHAFFDVNFQIKAADPPDSVAIVGIDAASIAQLGAVPWPRSTMAALVEKIAAAQARVIALDFEFPKREGSVENDSLAAVFGRVPNLVIPFRARLVTRDDPGSIVAIPQEAFVHRFMVVRNAGQLAQRYFYAAKQVDISDPLFARHARRSGFINVTTARSGQNLRELIHVVNAGSEYLPSFAVAATAAYFDLKPEELALDSRPAVLLGSRTLPLTTYAGSTFLNFRGSSGAIPTFSAVDVLSGKVGASQLRGKLIFVGMTDPGSAPDFFITPVGTQFPGVEIWATAAADIIEKKWIVPAGTVLTIVNWLLVLLIFPGIAFLIPGRQRFASIAIGGGLTLLSVSMSLLLFHTVHAMWNPEFHLYAFLFSLLWLAVQKADPTLVVAAGPLQLEPTEEGDREVLPPPRATDLLASIPPIATMQHVVKMLGGEQPPVSLLTPQGTMVEESSRLMPPPAPADDGILEKVRELGGAQIVRVLGSGGMADVYLVWNPRLEVYRAVKVIKPGQSEQLLDRFETEIKIFAALNHPNIVQCYTAGAWHDLPFLEMEFVPGMAMDMVMRKCGRLSAEQVLAVGILVCRGLHYAHSHVVNVYGQAYKGVVHRDLKPANILLSRSGRIKLTDFGIARPGAVSIHTMDSGKVVGTLPYLAPEQLDGKELTARTDIYALGATLYELATGRRAFPQGDITSLMSAKSKGTITPPEPGAQLPGALGAILSRAMAFSPQGRFATASDMGAALEAVLRKTQSPRSQSPLVELVRRVWE
jgi:serine/threonine-protein kinase